MLAWLQKGILVLLAILFLFFGLVFALNNQIEIELDFLFFRTPSLGVAVWLVAALVLGGVLGVLFSSMTFVRHSLQRKRLERRLSKAEKALETDKDPQAKGH